MHPFCQLMIDSSVQATAREPIEIEGGNLPFSISAKIDERLRPVRACTSGNLMNFCGATLTADEAACGADWVADLIICCM